MNQILTTILILSMAIISACDMRSGTAKEEMEKFSGSPTPTMAPTAAQTPIDPADIVQVDTNQEGGILTVNTTKQEKTLTCSKFNQVMVNSNGRTLSISGACRQIQVNGDDNQITVDAAAEFVLNGSGNNIKYSRFVNGKQPVISENESGNEIEKVAYEPNKSGTSKSGK